MQLSEEVIINKARKLTCEDAIKLMEDVINEIFEGRMEHKLDPTQAIVLGVFLQIRAYEVAVKIRDLYIELGAYEINYKDELRKELKKLTNEFPDYSDRKLKEMAISGNKKIHEYENKMVEINRKIDGLKDEAQHLSYLSRSWENVINVIKQEWKNS